MATTLESKERNVIPRWRTFHSTAALGELAPSKHLHRPDPIKIDTSDVEFDWKSNPTLSFAGDLISGAWVSGNLVVAREAAEFVLGLADSTEVGESLLSLSRKVLNRDNLQDLSQSIRTIDVTRKHIAEHRKMLNGMPRDAIRWVDISLLYVQQGQPDKAARAILIALNLAPTNRFVLRSAARFFLHSKDPERAHQILRKSSLLQVDPWIVSAELAVAGASRRVAFGLDFGKQMLSSSRFAPHETSELSAAFATLEFKEGNTSKSRRHVGRSLENPNENSLAQVQWLSPNLGGLPMHGKVRDFHVPRSYEALSWEAFGASDWAAGMHNALNWLQDEPFASRPAQFAAYCASLLEDFEMYEKIVRFGLVANPQYFGFHISLAFGYAMRNRVEEAEAELERLNGRSDPILNVQILANRGLIAFRRNQLELGRRFYQEAIDDAFAQKDNLHMHAAMIFWAREEIRINSGLGLSLLDKVEKAIDRKLTPQYGFLIDQARERTQEQLRKSITVET